MRNINNESGINAGLAESLNKKITVANDKNTQKSDITIKDENQIMKNSSEYKALIGRSQVKFKAKPDSVKYDLKIFQSNSKRVEYLNDFFELVYKKYSNNINNPYEFALLVTEEFNKMIGD